MVRLGLPVVLIRSRGITACARPQPARITAAFKCAARAQVALDSGYRSIVIISRKQPGDGAGHKLAKSLRAAFAGWSRSG